MCYKLLGYANLTYKNTKLTLRSNIDLLSFAAPSTAGFVGISPKGRGRDAARRKEGRKPSLPTPDKIEERRKQRQSSRLFFGYFLLAAFPRRAWEREKYLALGCEYPILKSSRYRPHLQLRDALAFIHPTNWFKTML